MDRENYPYFTEDEFTFFSKDGIDVVEKAHLSYKKRFEERIANFSLDVDIRREMNIVVLGKTGSGKSSTANAILGKDVFRANRSSKSVTKVSLDNKCTYKNRRITVVDTPGVHDTDTDDKTVAKQIARMAFLLKDGVHCFIICISASDTRFTEDLQDMLKQIKQPCRGNFFDYCMLAYTKAETELETCTLDEFIKQKKEHTGNRRLLENIKDRIVAVNNASPVPAEALRNRDALIEMVEVVVAHNRLNENPVSFKNDIFEKAHTLHVKLCSVVQESNFHPILVNATIEVIINISSSKLSFDVFSKEVIHILEMRQSSELSDEFADLFITVDETTKVNDIYIDQIKHIYYKIRPEVKTFMEKIFPIVLAAAAVGTAVVGTILRILIKS